MTITFRAWKILIAIIFLSIMTVWFSRPIYIFVHKTVAEYKIHENLIISLNNDTDIKVRKEIIVTMGRISEPQYADTVLEEMKKNPETIAEGVYALISIGKDCIFQILNELRKYQQETAQSKTRPIPGENDIIVKSEYDVKEVKYKMYIELKTEIVNNLIVNNPRLYYYMSLINVVGNIRDKRSIPLLLDIVFDENSHDYMKIFSLFSLIKINGSENVKYYLKSLKNKNHIIRRLSAYAIGNIYEKEKKTPSIEKYWGSDDINDLYTR